MYSKAIISIGYFLLYDTIPIEYYVQTKMAVSCCCSCNFFIIISFYNAIAQTEWNHYFFCFCYSFESSNLFVYFWYNQTINCVFLFGGYLGFSSIYFSHFVLHGFHQTIYRNYTNNNTIWLKNWRAGEEILTWSWCERLHTHTSIEF